MITALRSWLCSRALIRRGYQELLSPTSGRHMLADARTHHANGVGLGPEQPAAPLVGPGVGETPALERLAIPPMAALHRLAVLANCLRRCAQLSGLARHA